METPSFSCSEEREFSQPEEKSNQERQELTRLCERVAQMEHTLRMIYGRINTTHVTVKHNFEKIMEGFRAIEKCWIMSAQAQIETGDAVENFKEIVGQL